MSQNAGDYTYYPGCSLGASAHAYEKSIQAIASKLGLTFTEVNDWNCCGSTEYFSVNLLPAYSLVARNLSLAVEQNGSHDLIAPCSACFLNLRKTDDNMGKYKSLNAQVNQALAAGGISYEPGTIRVRHLLDVLVEDVGLDRIREHVVKPLDGLKVAPYYGCLIVRPETGYDTEYPTHLDDLMTALGAEVVDYPLKTHCCGGHMTQISEATAYELIRRLLENAADYDAQIIVTLCPMCQLNLDTYQGEVNHTFGTDFHIPVLFFTQLIGVAFGLKDDDLGIGAEMVSPKPALAAMERPKAKQRFRPKRRDKKALPMPDSGGKS